MKKKLMKAVFVLFAWIVFIIATAAATVEVRHDRTFDVAEVDVVASTDPDVIERGAYLAYGPAHCAYCHTTEDKHARLDAGERVPLSGGYVFDIGIAKLTTPNLTPDKETGIGDISDGFPPLCSSLAVRRARRRSRVPPQAPPSSEARIW